MIDGEKDKNKGAVDWSKPKNWSSFSSVMEAEEALEAQAPGTGERGGFTGRRQKILYVKEAKEKKEWGKKMTFECFPFFPSPFPSERRDTGFLLLLLQ